MLTLGTHLQELGQRDEYDEAAIESRSSKQGLPTPLYDISLLKRPTRTWLVSEAVMDVLTIALSILCLYVLFTLFKLLNKVWWTPLRIQRQMASQGIRGPPYKFLYGNTKEILKMRGISMHSPMELSSNDIFPRIFPHVPEWTKLYGENFLYWYGTQPQLLVTEPELIKDIFSRREKPKSDVFVKKLVGDGLIRANGEEWTKKRRLAVHAFNGDHLKGMIGAMIVSVKAMLDRWKEQEERDIEVYEEFRVLTSEVISRTAFGSSYLDGKNIFEKMIKMGLILSRNDFKIQIPVIRKLFRSGDDTEADKLGQSIRNNILEIVKSREEKVMAGEIDNYGNEFLGSLMKACHDPDETRRITEDDLVDECKTFYLAGHETTTSFLSWTMLLLAIHTDWQEKARKEVLELMGEQDPTADGISRMKTMSMIINESLRLYSPIASIPRTFEKGTTLKNITFPADIDVVVQPLSLHRNPQVWGEDVLLFKPERFAEGIGKATGNNNAAFLSFGWGPRTCVGMNFGTNEAKIALSMILQRYTFTLSPTYLSRREEHIRNDEQVGSHPIKKQSEYSRRMRKQDIPYHHHTETSKMCQETKCIRNYGSEFLGSFMNTYHDTDESKRITGADLIVEGKTFYLAGHETTTSFLSWTMLLSAMLPETITRRILTLLVPLRTTRRKNFLCWYGPQAELVVTDPKLVREILNKTNKGYEKGMIPAMVASTEALVKRWGFHDRKEIEVFEEFRLLTSEVISRTAFGSSYLEGQKMFEMLGTLSLIASRNKLKIRLPIIEKLLKSPDDIESDKLQQQIRDSILKMLRKREQKVRTGEADDFGSDFLGLFVKANDDPDETNRITVQDMVDECKTFYFAGHETLSNLLSWKVFLLALDKDWQAKARKEVLDLFGLQNPNLEGIARMKTMDMITNESIRLYKPAEMVSRQVKREVQQGKLTIPTNVHLRIIPLASHHDPQIWGEDVHLFKPDRFAEGVSKATNNNPAAFMPFGLGPRICVGLNFAMIEAKIALSMIQQHYDLTLTPNYIHSPIKLLTLRPQYGVQVILQAL
ncbi:Cytochrome P450 [Dillenia turbinata]|uniref:Cytochrome P450 n=1 Tax=Dillenia turbinata TaxID=194707 RepID=A0AAN8VBY2_9MAGN